MWKRYFETSITKKNKIKQNKKIAAGFAFTKAIYLLQLDFSLLQSVLHKTIQKDKDSTCKWTRALNQKSKPENVTHSNH